MRLIGIDPGYDRLGVAVIEKNKTGEKLIYSDCLISDRKASFADRLFGLGKELEKIIKQYRPGYLALEELFFAKNRKTALGVAETRGVIKYLARKHGLPVSEYAPAKVKLAITGYGHADKTQLIAMLPKLIKLVKQIKYDDEYDAIAVALTGLSTVGRK